jgi:hypothetical protein
MGYVLSGTGRCRLCVLVKVAKSRDVIAKYAYPKAQEPVCRGGSDIGTVECQGSLVSRLPV